MSSGNRTVQSMLEGLQKRQIRNMKNRTGKKRRQLSFRCFRAGPPLDARQERLTRSRGPAALARDACLQGARIDGQGVHFAVYANTGGEGLDRAFLGVLPDVAFTAHLRPSSGARQS